MPPKQRFSPEDVIEAAFRVVRKHGWDGFSARAIANELNSSVRPIYEYFQTMENIEAEVVQKILAYFVEFINQDRTGDKWLDQALGYVIFASNEKHLFRSINDEKHTLSQKKFGVQHWDKLGERLSEDERFKDLPDEVVNKIRGTRWIFVHGLAYLISNGWYASPTEEPSEFKEEFGYELSYFLQRVSNGIFEEFKVE